MDNISYGFNKKWNTRYSTPEFENTYTYQGNDLGSTYAREKTLFVLWSPFAKSVSVNIFEHGDAEVSDMLESVSMNKGENGTWRLELEGDYLNKYYTYSVKFDDEYNQFFDCEICDPYAKACGVNGKRAMVVDLMSTNPENWETDENPNRDLKQNDYVIYELHTRDLSSLDSSGIKNKGKFLGLTENKTTVDSEGTIATGIDHIKEMGITHVHLLPFYDYATIDESKPFNSEEYNWGYDPLNYNVPEGSYSTDPYDGNVRIKELKETIKAFHENGISVIMDVVYNHTFNEEFCFNKAVPGYFYRIDENGERSNGSACGNDTASERSMVSKFIADSVEYWAKEYHLDGFRFDLVGLIDVDTINEIRRRLDKIRPDIFLYGEGWDLDTVLTRETKLAKQENTYLLNQFAMFNDDIRDAIKGSVFEEEEKGFISGNEESKELMLDSIKGLPTWSTSPCDVINYTSCHDNYTLFDKIRLCNENISFEDAVKQNLLAISIVMFSQGTPLIHAGEEILRTKTDADGSYVSDSVRSSDSVNGIDWAKLKQKEYMDVYQYYKGIIEIRKKYDLLRYNTKEEAKKNIMFAENNNEQVIEYTITDKGREMLVVFNASQKPYSLEKDLSGYTILVEGNQAKVSGIRKAESQEKAEPLSTMVFVKTL